MSKSYIQSVVDLNASISRLDASIQCCGRLLENVGGGYEGSLDEKTKELIATAMELPGVRAASLFTQRQRYGTVLVEKKWLKH